MIHSAVQHLVCSNCGGSDSASLVAAIASVFVALITLGVVIATFKTASATRRAAQATERSANVEAEEAKATLAQARASADLVTLTREQMTDAQMPIVVPVADPTRGMTILNNASIFDLVPRMIEGTVFVVPVTNVGTGPALGIETIVTLLDGPEPVRPPQRVARHAALGAGGETVIRLRIGGAQYAVQGRFGLTLRYKDSVGRRYEATADYEPASMSYPLMGIAIIDADGAPVRTIVAGGRDLEDVPRRKTDVNAERAHTAPRPSVASSTGSTRRPLADLPRGT